MLNRTKIKSVGILGFGAFGRLIAKHLSAHVDLQIHDPALGKDNLIQVGQCDVVILSVPVKVFDQTIDQLNPHLKPGAIVVDVGSVKMVPDWIMREKLPSTVEIVGTHPLFGPQSTKDGIMGRKIAVCPIRGKSAFKIAAFLKRILGLQVFITSAEKHDKDAAIVQGLTHLIARILLRMEPLPRNLTTASFDHLLEAIDMVRFDSENVYMAIEQENPFAADIRNQFFDLAEEIRAEIDTPANANIHPLRLYG